MCQYVAGWRARPMCDAVVFHGYRRAEVTLASSGASVAAHLYLPGMAVGRSPAVVICHGLGSRKERHSDYASLLVAHGFAVLALDLRGHGESTGRLDGREHEDVVAACRYLANHPSVDGGKIAVRGSSLGGMVAIRAAAEAQSVAAVVAICPASGRLLQDGLSEAQGDVLEGDGLCARLDTDSLLAALERRLDLDEDVRALSPRPLLMLHAEGDETVPCASSQHLMSLPGRNRDLWLFSGGSHTSVQHDLAAQKATASWLVRRMNETSARGGVT